MNRETLSSKDIMLAIPYLPDVATGLLGKGKPYDALLLEILKYNPLNEEDQHFPSNKELQTILKLTSTKLRTQLENLYEDFIGSINTKNTALYTGELLVEFYIRGYFKSVSFFARVKQLPRVGDQLEFPFLRPYFQNDAFYVQEVYHNFENDEQRFTVWVKQGFFNLYEHLELSRAKSEGRYDWKTDRITKPAARTQNYSSVKTNH
jgi:hypothetical protein